MQRIILLALPILISCTAIAQEARRPAIISRPILTYPGEARTAGIEGTIYVRGLVGTDGKVIKTEIAKREPELAFVFDEEARRYVMHVTFSPAQDSSSQPVEAWVVLPVQFSIPDFEPAALLEVAKPEYPAKAIELGMESWIGLAVQLDEMGFVIGDVKPVILARGHPEVTIFDRQAIDAARRSRFAPARGKDGPQRAWAFVKIDFHLPSSSPDSH